MKRRRSCPPIQTGSASFAGFRFPPEVILLAVRWYLRYGLPYRDLEELLAERGIAVDHVTLYRWVQRFTPLIVDAARPCRHAVGDRWFVDETYVKVAGTWRGTVASTAAGARLYAGACGSGVRPLVRVRRTRQRRSARGARGCRVRSGLGRGSA